MQQATGQVSPNGGSEPVAIRPAIMPSQTFVLRERYVRVESERPGYEGLWAEVRLNLSNGERRAFIEALDESGADRARMVGEAELYDLAVSGATDPATKAAAEDERRLWITALGEATAREAAAQQALIAPYVRAWNLGYVDDETGTAPAPAVGSAESWEYADDTIRDWLRVQLITAYRGGKGVRRSSPPPAKPESATPPPSDEAATTGT